jgi:hypothetical protein
VTGEKVCSKRGWYQTKGGDGDRGDTHGGVKTRYQTRYDRKEGMLWCTYSLIVPDKVQVM